MSYTRSREDTPYEPRLDIYPIKTDALTYFIRFFPLSYKGCTVIHHTNVAGQKKFKNRADLTLGKFLKWLGIRFFKEVIRLTSIKK